MKFTKMHGIGNDFVMLDALKTPIEESKLCSLAVKFNDRRMGVGGDGLILILPSESAPFRMRMFNPDGSEAEMCGNGIRCFAKYVYDRKLTDATDLNVETNAGVLPLKLNVEDGKAATVQVNMGAPRLKRIEIPMLGGSPEAQCINEPIEVNGKTLSMTAVSMGNPHIVLFVDDVSSVELEKDGPFLETHPLFPQRTNVHFVQVINPGEIKIRTWERGAGMTLACGTGACACVVASALNEKTGREALVHLPGGDLQIEWRPDNQVMMTGPAEEVYSGETSF